MAFSNPAKKLREKGRGSSKKKKTENASLFFFLQASL